MQVDISELSSLAEETHPVTGLQSADRYICATADEDHNILHIELQSTADPNICLRMLSYSMQYAEPLGQGVSYETYKLPYSTLVNVRKTSQSGTRTRSLQMAHGSQLLRVDYLVVEGYKEVPNLETVMQAKTLEECQDAIISFLQDVPYSGGFAKADRLIKACLLISKAESYTNKGVDEGRLDMETNEVKKVEYGRDYFRRLAIEHGEAKGRAEAEQQFDAGLHNLARKLGKAWKSSKP